MEKRKPKEEMTFEERVEKFQKYWDDPEQQYKIFSELGFTYVDDSYDGVCPAREQKDRCDVCPEIDWEDEKKNFTQN